MKAFHLVIVGGFILVNLIFANGQSPGTQARQDVSQTVQTKQAKAKKVLVEKQPEGLEGVVLEDGKFKLKPGYKFLPQSNGKVGIALQAGGRGVKGSFNCACLKTGGGGCAILTVEGELHCSKSDEKPCSDYCSLVVIIQGLRTKLAIF
jgi:hypothetical protein